MGRVVYLVEQELTVRWNSCDCQRLRISWHEDGESCFDEGDEFNSDLTG
jgi:hypothetical protein